jgi:hypothetical protein
MSVNLRVTLAALLGIAASWSTLSVEGAPITTWRTFKASPATVVDSGQGTSSPVFGNTTTTSAASRLIGYFPAQTLVNVGDKISLTFAVGFNDATGVQNGGDNFRYALFDVGGEAVPATENVASAGSADTNAFVGYWAGVMTGSGTAGSLRERFDTTNNDMFANGSASANLATPPITGTNVAIAGQVNGTGTLVFYGGVLTITRTVGGVDIAGSFSGNGGANTFAVSDASPASLTYGAVGFLNGSGISADQVIFQNVDVAYTPVPEPAVCGLLGCSLVGATMLRRRFAC